jgi:hypothetical protein
MRPLVQKRITEYNIPGAELNQDQIRSVASLPHLEAAIKELEEIKKSIEVRRPTYFTRFSNATDDDVCHRLMSWSTPKRNRPRELRLMRLKKLRLSKPSRKQRFGSCLPLTTFTLETRWHDSQATSKANTRLLLTLARLPTLSQHSHPHFSAEVTETESSTILSAAEILTDEDSQSKEEIISGFLSGEGELEGIPCKGIFLPGAGSNFNQSHHPRFQVD